MKKCRIPVPMECGILLFELSEIFFGIVSGIGTVSHGGDHLTQRFGPHIACGKDTGEVGAGGFISCDIAVGIQNKLVLDQVSGRAAADADKDTVAGYIRKLAGNRVF